MLTGAQLARGLAFASVADAPQSEAGLVGELPLPPDFPVVEYDSAVLAFRTRIGATQPAPESPWVEFSAAWVAVLYRFLDVATFDGELRRSLKEFGTAPAPADRYRQERLLFGFFVSGLSALESFCYGLCAIAWEAHPKKVSLASLGQKKNATAASTLDRFSKHFRSDAVTATLRDLLESQA